ncbi:hypothetical protein WDU94_012647 [Cyamophila willieti]
MHHSKTSSFSVFVLICLILPANVIRLSELNAHADITKFDIFYISFMYWETFYVATLELQFVIICYSIYLRFFEINVMLENIYNDYQKPMFDKIVGQVNFHVTKNLVIQDLDTTEYRIMESIPIDCINFEYIRISHLFLCEAYIVLNNIFKYQILLSLGCCFATSLLDLYYEFFAGNEVINTTIKLKVYCWIVQYFVRFACIVIVAHKTTIESMRAKSLVTSMNDQTLSNDIREEVSFLSTYTLMKGDYHAHFLWK